MELIALWKFLLRRWWIILLPAAVALGLTAQELLAPPGGGWTTTLHLTAAQPPSSQEPSYEDSSYTPWTASEYLVNSLTAWVRTSSFAEEVSRLLAGRGIEVDPGALRASIASDNARSVMQLTISWPDPAELQVIAEAAITVLQTLNQAYFPQLTAEPAEVVALDDISVVPVAPPLSSRLRPLLKVGLALLAGLALAGLVEYLDDSIRSRQDLEELELPVLGEIPRHRGQV